jgi:hypothetical protein
MTPKLDIRPGSDVRLTAAIRTPRGVRVLN